MLLLNAGEARDERECNLRKAGCTVSHSNAFRLIEMLSEWVNIDCGGGCVFSTSTTAPSMRLIETNGIAHANEQHSDFRAFFPFYYLVDRPIESIFSYRRLDGCMSRQREGMFYPNCWWTFFCWPFMRFYFFFCRESTPFFVSRVPASVCVRKSGNGRNSI